MLANPVFYLLIFMFLVFYFQSKPLFYALQMQFFLYKSSNLLDLYSLVWFQHRFRIIQLHGTQPRFFFVMDIYLFARNICKRFIKRHLILRHFAYVNRKFISFMTFYRSVRFWHHFNEFYSDFMQLLHRNVCILHFQRFHKNSFSFRTEKNVRERYITENTKLLFQWCLLKNKHFYYLVAIYNKFPFSLLLHACLLYICMNYHCSKNHST